MLLVTATAPALLAADLESDLGRNETRVLSAPYAVTCGKTVEHLSLEPRLERLHYRRVKGRPAAPGEYFHGNEVFWFYRRACHVDGKDREPELVGLALAPQSRRIVGRRGEGKPPRPFDEGAVWLEPEVLSESLKGDRADRVPITLDALPEHVWRCILAAEDARFFEHGAIDPRAVARAAFRNLRKGRVVEGGSTITQQLVKNRDLSSERTLSRKASEAMRAAALEARYGKKEILQAYLNTVYLGNVAGMGVYGVGAAARTYFSKPAAELSLAEAAILAAMIQGPNRLSPLHDREALRERRNWVLARMEEMGWAQAARVARAKAEGVSGEKLARPRTSAPQHVLSWIAHEVASEERSRFEQDRGFIVETTIDPYLEKLAERALASRLDALRRENPHLRGAKLSAALVALDARTGAVIAYVGGAPEDGPGAFDRVRAAKRQPGSAVKPFVVLEALDSCGTREPLTASDLVLDAPLEIVLPKGSWKPVNFDHGFVGEIPLREALSESRNVPAVRVARWCGFAETASTFERLGLDLPAMPPPSFVLGSVETSPLALARAYTVLATPGRVLEPYAVARVESSGGRTLARTRPVVRKVVAPAAAYIVRDLLRTAVEEGTATVGEIEGVEVAAKTGTSSELRDAWFAGHAGSVVAVVWVGLDDGGRLGLTGTAAAGPLWREFMSEAVRARPDYAVERPRDVVEAWVQERTGLLVGAGYLGARAELYREDTLPPRKRWWRFDRPMPVVE